MRNCFHQANLLARRLQIITPQKSPCRKTKILAGLKTPAADLESLLRLPDKSIDTSDIPEIADWTKAVVGKFYRPIKTPVTIRLDADVLAWLKRPGSGYQTRINALLRHSMLRTRPS